MLFFSTPQLFTLSALGAVVCSKILNHYDTRDIWSTLNQSVHGRLHASAPFALPCFSSYNGKPFQGDPAACSSIQKNYNSSLFRDQFFNGYMNFQDEVCASVAGDGCLLDNSDPSDPLAYKNVSCNQGSVPEHYIDVQEPDDVIKALKFAKETGIRLSIKNSGSSNSGRNSLKGSLGLWVRHLNNISYDRNFTPEGCRAANTAQMSVTVGAGVNNGEVMQYSGIHNFTFAGAYADIVGVSGGWVQGGGEGVLCPVYGLGADRVLQYKIVTPDGVLRIANACQNQDLFWALRGGGGGTFGVVLESTHKVEEAFNVTIANITFPRTPANYLPFVDRIINSTAQWAQEGWGGNINPGIFVTVTPLLSLAQANESLKSITDFALSQNGTAVLESLTYVDFYNKFVRPFPPPIGTAHALSTRLIPTAMFKTPAARAKMLSFLQNYAKQRSYAYIIPVGPVLFPHVLNSTSYTPAWLDSYWLLGLHPPEWAWNSTVAQKREVVEATWTIDKSIEELTPGSGTHFNEADPFTRDWRQAYWGDNYEPLVQIKRKYDPDGLLNCFRCVGFEEDDQGFECYRGLGGGQ
ncbi:hypothetical protein N7G274_006189 [Stereocaulon virgatum]|uniref:FAD-binding PCMH-type domain-containing protein n=1 Tax=Stereocaulon virgatum TaxID=373712 RepID=A0ABR4A6W3_9LECA